MGKKAKQLDSIPERYSIWRHVKSGVIYKFLLITNLKTSRHEEYPVTVVYQNLLNGDIWSRPLNDWYRSMTKVTKWVS